MDLYQVCIDDAPGVRIGPTPGNTSWNITNKESHLKIPLLRKCKVKSFDIWFLHLLVDLYQVCSYDACGVKTGPATGVTSLNIRTKKTNFKILLL